ncbi:hypothetical protein OU995_25905 [Roseateles sp. SL47]|uniref:hypothetical protein n=1 Tax=Roseateles sp. SL47 TaxID=2995138 RepID=UPI00226F0B64|nr:hypothetical protein [Roseateles sp. SL47]WAC72906.1 hypothetical protein OU995_25905 [Roseateles sp. SL47]
MFATSVPPMAERMSALYGPAAFEPLPPAQAPTAPDHWLSFQPTSDDVQKDLTTFLRSTQFQQVHDQCLERLRDCETFATQHGSAKEGQRITDAFATLRGLLTPQGCARWPTNRLAEFYGPGKRALDQLCLHLRRQPLDLHHARAVLQDLAHDLCHCNPALAIAQAEGALAQDLGGLRGEFAAVRDLRTDAVLRDLYEEFVADELPELRILERTVAAWIRRELKIPTPPSSLALYPLDVEDAPRVDASLNTIGDLIMDNLKPAVLALDLAERFQGAFMAHLSGAASAAVSHDLNHHMPELRRVHGELSRQYPGVGLHSVLESDLSTDQVRLRSDASLIAVDLLQSLTALGITRPRRPTQLWEGTTRDSQWSLQALDDQLFYISERIKGQSDAWRTSVQPKHLHDQGLSHLPSMTERQLTHTTLRAARPEDLPAFPARFLKGEDTAHLLLARMDGETERLWLAAQSNYFVADRAALMAAAAQRARLPVIKDILTKPYLLCHSLTLLSVSQSGVIERLLTGGHQECLQLLLTWAADKEDKHELVDGALMLLLRDHQGVLNAMKGHHATTLAVYLSHQLEAIRRGRLPATQGLCSLHPLMDGGTPKLVTTWLRETGRIECLLIVIGFLINGVEQGLFSGEDVRQQLPLHPPAQTSSDGPSTPMPRAPRLPAIDPSWREHLHQRLHRLCDAAALTEDMTQIVLQNLGVTESEAAPQAPPHKT